MYHKLFMLLSSLVTTFLILGTLYIKRRTQLLSEKAVKEVCYPFFVSHSFEGEFQCEIMSLNQS